MNGNIGFVFDGKKEASCDVIEGFYITLTQRNIDRQETLHYDFSLYLGDAAVSVSRYIEENLPPSSRGPLLSYTAEDRGITLDFLEGCRNESLAFVKKLASFLREQGIRSRCVHCSAFSNLGFYRWGNRISVLCSDCGGDLTARLQEKSRLPSNYFTGFLLSLTFALMGSAIWIAIGASGLYASFAGYLIAWAAFRGYKAAKGKLDVRGLFLMGFSVVIAFTLANYMDLFICFKRSIPDMTFGSFVYATPVLFSDKGFIEEWGLDFFLGVTFVLLGSEDAITECIRERKKAFYADIRKI